MTGVAHAGAVFYGSELKGIAKDSGTTTRLPACWCVHCFLRSTLPSINRSPIRIAFGHAGADAARVRGQRCLHVDRSASGSHPGTLITPRSDKARLNRIPQCTALAQDSGPQHIRTMDWGMEWLRPLTIEVDFIRGGKTQYVATTWVGYVGVLTGTLLVIWKLTKAHSSFCGTQACGLWDTQCRLTSG